VSRVRLAVKVAATVAAVAAVMTKLHLLSRFVKIKMSDGQA